MYSYANLLLLALAAAALWDLAYALRQPCAAGLRLMPRLQAGLELLFRERHFLFGNWQGSLFVRAAGPLFCTALGLYTTVVVLQSSLLPGLLPWLTPLLQNALEPLALLCLTAKLLLCTQYTWAELAPAGAVYFIARWVFFNSQDIWLIWLILFAFAAKEVDLGWAVRCFLAVMLFWVALVSVLSLVGVIENIYWEDPYRHRWYFGFSHPNTLGGFLMALACGWVFLRARHWRWPDLIPLLALELFNDLGPYVRSLQVVFRGMLVVLVLLMLVPRRWFRPRWVRALLALGPVWFFIFTWFLVGWYDHHWDPLIDHWNICLTGRIYLQSQTFQLFGVPIAGQVLPEWPSQDNCFVAGLYKYGPVLSALLWAGVCVLLWQLLHTGRIYTAILLECMLVYAYFEIIFLHITGNPLLLLLCGPLFFTRADRLCTPEPCRPWPQAPAA